MSHEEIFTLKCCCLHDWRPIVIEPKLKVNSDKEKRQAPLNWRTKPSIKKQSEKKLNTQNPLEQQVTDGDDDDDIDDLAREHVWILNNKMLSYMVAEGRSILHINLTLNRRNKTFKRQIFLWHFCDANQLVICLSVVLSTAKNCKRLQLPGGQQI